MDDWPDCSVPGCPRKCCLALNSSKCFPHTAGNEHVKRWKIDARNAESHLIRNPWQLGPEVEARRP